jgi:TonB-dependent SusC/RagA subfamily outer membrane receptor
MHVRSQAPRLRHAALATMLLAVATAGCQSLAQTGSRPLADREAINVGYGTMERSRITSSVASLDSTDIARQPVASLEEALGRLPGVQVLRTAQGLQVRIRGTSSFLGTNDPLYVIDGIPITFGMARPLSGLNPNDVARVDVLKDGAASIYGSRGANGVILITTKRAR